MKNHSLLFIFLSLFSILSVFSCKKSGNDNPFGNQKIATIVQTQGGAILNRRIVYDQYNNVDSIITTGGGTNSFLAFSYIGSSFTITDQDNNSYLVDANTNGQMLKVNIADTIYFTYNGNQLNEISVYSATLTPPGYINTAYYYTWSNGDVTTITSPNINQTYTYNTSKNGQPGDAIRINYFLTYGQSPIKTNLLPTALVNSSTQGQNYFYTLDSKGRISMLTEVTYDSSAGSTDTTTLAYTYY